MYLEHFGLRVPPFGISQKLEFLYESDAFAESIAHLVYGLEHSEAIVLITGPVGSGKTMAINSFLEHLGDSFVFALVTNTQVTAIELLKLILEDLGVSYPVGCDKSDLLILFKDKLKSVHSRGQRLLIVVDEAQNLSKQVLEELRLLTNLGQGEFQPVQVIMVGQPELEDVVCSPDLSQLRQRIRVHYSLAPLSLPETAEYIRHRMTIAGCSKSPFDRHSIDQIYTVSQGLPRVVNTLAGEALLSAYVDGRLQVQVGDVAVKNEPIVRVGVLDRPIIETHQGAAAKTDLDSASSNMEGPKAQGPIVGIALALLVLIALGAYLIPHLGWREQSYQFAAVASSNDEAIAAIKRDTLPSAVGHSEQRPLATSEDERDNFNMASESNDLREDFLVHISSFRSLSRAENLVSHLQEQGYPCATKQHEIRDVSWIRVYLGPFDDRDTALHYAERYVAMSSQSYYRIIEDSDVISR